MLLTIKFLLYSNINEKFSCGSGRGHFLADLSTIWKSCNFSLRFKFLGHQTHKEHGSTHRGSLGASARPWRLVPICCCHGNFRHLAVACDETKRWTVTTSENLIASSAVQHVGRLFFCCRGASATWKHHPSGEKISFTCKYETRTDETRPVCAGHFLPDGTNYNGHQLLQSDVKMNAHFIVINGLIKCVISCEFL